ncbi:MULTISPECIES: ATP-binding protein [Nostocales]|uniref:histidine kinase n=2 Tax=Nostocales TaxID=1161 RepID=A0ABW8WNW5_9CYAN|nr:ATP-binding protein [Tolypothrix bouteillei]
MQLRSFRLRIALLSAALAGSTLIGFGVTAWWQISDAKRSRLDAQLENRLFLVASPRFYHRWQSYESFIQRELKTDAETPVALLVMDRNGSILYQSHSWSVGLKTNNLWSPRPHFFRVPPPPDRENPLSPQREQQPPPEESRSPKAGAFPPRRYRRSLGEPPPPPRFVTQQTTEGTWRIGAVTFPHTLVAIAVSLNAVDREMVAIRNIFLVSIPGALLLVAGGAWLISGSTLHSIRRLNKAIEQVTVKGLDQRVPLGTTDVEFVKLIEVFNQMLERLERSFKQASRFSADAAHELKTPLAILQGELEQTLQQAEPGSQIQQNLSNLLDEVQRFSGIVRKLLLLSLADTGQMSLHQVEVDISQLLIEMTEDIELLAPHLHVQTSFPPELRAWGDRDLLTQSLQNLLSNAIKYNLPEGWIKIHGYQQAGTVFVTISNSSQNILPGDRERIFDRFYRGDPARTRKVDGVGLGLSLAREIARYHGGDLTLDPTPVGQTAFTLRLPTR